MSSQASKHGGATQTARASIKNLIGGNICKRRKALGMTQAELARELEIEVMQISRWERGKTRPNAHSEAQLAAALFGGEIALLYDEDSLTGENRRAA